MWEQLIFAWNQIKLNCTSCYTQIYISTIETNLSRNERIRVEEITKEALKNQEIIFNDTNEALAIQKRIAICKEELEYNIDELEKCSSKSEEEKIIIQINLTAQELRTLDLSQRWLGRIGNRDYMKEKNYDITPLNKLKFKTTRFSKTENNENQFLPKRKRQQHSNKKRKNQIDLNDY